MKIEVGEFYPFEKIKNKKNVKGTINVYLIDLKMDLRGVFVSKSGNSWYIMPPHIRRTSIEEAEGSARFPVITFTDPKTSDEFMQALKTEIKKYMQEYLEKLVID